MYIQLDSIKDFLKMGNTSGPSPPTPSFKIGRSASSEDEPEFVYPEDDIDKILAEFNKPLPKKEVKNPDSSRKFLIFFVAIVFILIANLYTSGIVHFLKIQIKNIMWFHYIFVALGLTVAMIFIDWVFDINLAAADNVNINLDNE